MAIPSGFRIGAIVVLAALAGMLGVVLFGGSPSDADYRPPRLNQSQLVLRLTDMPSGYANSYLGEGRGADGLLCEAFSRDSGQAGPVAEFARRYRANGCIAAYESRFEVPGQAPVAAVVFSGVTALGSGGAAADAWDLVPTMLGRILTGGPPREVKTDARIGAQTRLFHTSRAWLPYQIRGKQRASFLAWRSGNTVAAVVAVGGSFATNDRVVAELAPRQQEHVLEPTPYTKDERSDAEVGLDDPAIDLPVFWLGRVFDPGGRLPSTALHSSAYRGKPIPERAHGSSESPYPPLEASYERIRLATWTPQAWRLFANSKTGKAITSWRCTQTRTVPIAGGSATIFGGYEQDYARCPQQPPRAFTAWVDVGGVKVVVNPPFAPDFIEAVNPYGSFAGMEAIVRALELRPKPVY